ncbi:BREX system ATP-binding domain-containing protein [Streptomyces sp. CA-288835]|uniref:BREX system ATP-binding domain-containing protein n=1 Tax=Streptomyces sp. CA-288835 TaxID=3240069 RepID=UPI003D9262C0
MSGAGGPLDLGPPQRRVLLLRLLLEAGRPVGSERLREDLWEGRPPSSAMSSVHAHISKLRSVLDDGSRPGRSSRILVSTSAGYALAVSPEARDTVEFERAAGQGSRLEGQGRWARARRVAENALQLWRGHPYAEARGLSFARGESDRLIELHWSVQELRARMLLAEGQPREAVVAADGLVSRDPLRETSWVILLRALYAAGRGAEALRRYETVRRTLAEALGTDPGPELRRIHLAILRHEVDVSPVGRQTAVVAGGSGDLRGAGETGESRGDGDEVDQLDEPWAAADGRGRGHGPDELPLVGRDTELARLLKLLPDARAGRTGWAVVCGQAGSGKTRLVQELAERARREGFAVVQDRFPKRVRAGAGASDGGQVLRLLQALRYGAGRPDDGGPVPVAGPGQGAGDAPAEDGPLAGRPALCLVEDAQGASAAVVNALADCAETLHGAQVAVVCTMPAAPDPVTDELRAALARGAAEHLELRPLDLRDIEELLRGRHQDAKAAVATDEAGIAVATVATGQAGVVAATATPDEAGIVAETAATGQVDFVEATAATGRTPAHSGESLDDTATAAAELHALTGGNPFLLTEMLRLPRDQRSGPGRRLPAAVASVMRVRLAALDADSRGVLEMAAVIGDRIDVPLLARACALPASQVLRALDTAVEADIVVWTPAVTRSVPPDYAFSCGLIRAALLAAPLPSRQDGLRAAAARALAAEEGPYASDFARARVRRIA